MYLNFLTLGFVVSYFILAFVFSLFFEKQTKPGLKKVISSLVSILVLSLVTQYIASVIPNPDIANRFLHSVAGGVLALFVCFIVVRDFNFKINKIQFFIFAILLVTALGVVNELAEFICHHFFGQIMADSIEDTWLDLVSNTAGALVSAFILVPFIKK